MASNEVKETNGLDHPESPDHAVANQQAGDEDLEHPGEALITLEIILPHEPRTMSILVSPQEQVHEVRQSVIDLPAAFRYTCFHLEHKGQRVNDFVSIAEVPNLLEDPVVTLVEDPYTEKEARIHFVRIRELIGAAGDRTDLVQGVLPGLSLLDSVAETSEDAASKPAFGFGSRPDISRLLPPVSPDSPKTVKTITLSPWNPPPPHLKQRGHLLYLILTTNEGEQLQITAHVSGFFVNKSANAKFDPFPRPSPKGQSSHSLLGLLELVSPGFSAAFLSLQEFNNKKDPLATFQIAHAIPAAPWAVPSSSSSLLAHVSDPTRSQETYLIAGADNTDTLRDWNEEFQSAKELPKETVQDRVFRERLISKLFADYNDAATRGAILVARGEIPPLNPTESKDAQIFVYNNVFFSFGADGVGTFASEGGDEAARVATGKDVAGVRLVNQIDVDGLFTTATVVVDYLGKRVVGQSIVPGIFKPREPGENQIDYGAVEGKDIVASDERFASTFEKLSKALKVKKHPVWDKDGKRVDLEASVETKGLMGTDGRKYVLDLYRVTPLDISWLEQQTEDDGAEYPHRMTVLRPELVDSFGRKKMKEWVDVELEKRKKSSQETTDDAEARDTDDKEEKETEEDASTKKKEHIDLSEFQFSLNPDVFSGQAPTTDAEKAELEADEKEVRNACDYLIQKVLPDFVRELEDAETSFPMDGQALGRLLHKRGINIRYLGKVATLASGPRLQCLKDVALQDMIARAFKHIASGYLRDLPPPFAPICIAHLLNCLLGAGLNSKPVAEADIDLKTLYAESDFSYENVTPETLQSQVSSEILKRFRYQLADNWFDSLRHLQLLREISLKLGLQLQARQYAFAAKAESPSVNDNDKRDESTSAGQVGGEGKKKKKSKNRDSSPSSPGNKGASHTFTSDDVVNIVPVVKHSAPRSTLAEEALEAGRISIMQGQKKLGQELLLESLSLHEQIYGIVHPEVARVYNTLSMIYYQLDEKEAAVELARKAIVVAERTMGVDSTDTLLNYLNLSLFLHQTGDSRTALAYVKHALELWKIIYGADHPDSITTINNGAVMLQHLKAYRESREWFEESLRVCTKVFGEKSINAATLLFQLAQALALDQDSKAAVIRMRESWHIFKAELGADDKNTKEAESWLTQLTQNAVSIAKHAKDAQARRLRVPFETTNVLAPSTSTRTDDRSIEDLLKYIEGDSKQASQTSNRQQRGNPKRRTKA
ncbi:eukaryotic translation initiation factor 3 135 kDa subunit [Plectosphaerella plurivora]|uniref:Clustered mitochondria protein homolog n=1 Tax=Plectosphaerella plurivora TaxID=936078 RepID=A0A9P8V0K6_9PEZI|nr:eukaryotic translation initiation factor 3 135 kDa subunit [Plectosphaerella plurivora]